MAQFGTHAPRATDEETTGSTSATTVAETEASTVADSERSRQKWVPRCMDCGYRPKRGMLEENARLKAEAHGEKWMHIVAVERVN
jgi:hypothetical protein